MSGKQMVNVSEGICFHLTLQIMSDDYKKNADSNAFLKHLCCSCPVACKTDNLVVVDGWVIHSRLQEEAQEVRDNGLLPLPAELQD